MRLAAVEIRDLHLALLLKCQQDQRERADGVAAAIADALARMTAEQAAHVELVCRARLRRLAAQRALEREIDAACAADRQLVIVLRIAVDEELRIRQMLRIERDGARHAALLVRRDDEAQRAVVFRVLHEIDAFGDADAIIRAEARALGFEVLVRAHELDWVFERVIVIAFLADRDHVHVALQNRARRVLIALCRRLISDDVVLRVLHDGKACVRQVFLEEIADGLLMAVRTRDGREFLELIENAFQNIHVFYLLK